MPRTAEALQLTDAYRNRLLTIRQRAVQTVRATWASIDPQQFDQAFAIWRRTAAGALTDAQAFATALSDTYFAAYLSSELATRVAPRGLDALERAGTASDGRPVEDLLDIGAIAVRVSLASQLPPTEALARGRRRVERAVATEVVAAGRGALDELLTSDDRIVGWRRATSGNPCGACMAAATGAIQDSAELIEGHEQCRCGKEPVVRGVRERVQRPTGQELFDAMSAQQQDDLFAGRGGQEKAELLRAGAVSLSDLVTAAPHEHRTDGIVETPLEALKALAST